MGTFNRFNVYLGGVQIASAWSLHSAQEKLTAAVILRAQRRGNFPVEGQIHNALGHKLITRVFPGFFDAEGELHGS